MRKINKKHSYGNDNERHSDARKKLKINIKIENAKGNGTNKGRTSRI